jgi:hypothetical protein
LDRLWYLGLAGLLLAFAGLRTWRPLNGFEDFWAHAAVGRWVWQNGQFPRETLFLWTASEPWVYHSWLSQVLFFGLTNIGGPTTFPLVVVVFTLLAALAPFAVAAWLWRRTGRGSSWMVLPFALAIEGLYIRFQARPELFTELFLSLLLAYLVCWSTTPRVEARPLLCRRDKVGMAAVLLMFIAWTNFHAGVVLGLLVLWVTAVCELVQDKFSPRSAVLALLALVAPLTVCVNPYGLAYVRAYQPVVGTGFAHIVEWISPLKPPPFNPPELALALEFVVPLALLAWLLNPRRRWAQAGWLLLLGAMFLRERRHVWPLLIVSVTVLAANAAVLDPETLWRKLARLGTSAESHPSEHLPILVRWLGRLALVGWLGLQISYCLYTFRYWDPLAPAGLEKGVVQFIEKHKLDGRVFNDYENSSYLQWRLAGKPALFIDLLNAYPDSVWRDYHDIIRLTDHGRELLEQQNIGIVVLTTNRPRPPSLAGLADFLDKDSHWVRVFADRDGVIWVQRTPEYEHIWRPLDGSVSTTEFAALERYSAANVVAPPVFPEDIGKGRVTGNKDRAVLATTIWSLVAQPPGQCGLGVGPAPYAWGVAELSILVRPRR